MSAKEKLLKAIKDKMRPEELLKVLTPLDLKFHIKILANQCFQNVRYDYAFLFQFSGEDSPFDDPADLESFLGNFLAARGSNYTVKSAKCKQGSEIFTAIFLNLPKHEPTCSNSSPTAIS